MSEEYKSGEAMVDLYTRLRRRGALLVIAALVALFVVAVLFPTQPYPPPDYSKLGVHLLLDDGRGVWPVEVWPEHLAYAAQVTGTGGTVTQLVRADDLDPARWQVFMDLSTEHGLTPILRLATVYDHDQGLWVAPEADPDGRYHTVAEQYASFVATLAWPSEAHYVIVGNEPNHGNEWGGRPDPAAYARFLIDVADALHEADPQARVLNAGLDLFVLHTGDQPFADGFYYLDIESFMDAMIAAEPEVFGHIDAWASHPYPLGPFRAPPWDQEYRFDAINDAVPDHVRPPSGIVNRGINGYEWELWKLSTYGIRDLPVVITETGWRHREAISPSLDGGEDYPDAATVAVYFDLALRGNDGSYPDMRRDGWLPWLSDPRVIAVTPFALDGAPGEWGHTNWLQIEADGAVLGTYALFDLLAAYPDG